MTDVSVPIRGRGIVPVKVLKGESGKRKYRNVRAVFKNVTIQSLLKQIYESYKARSVLGMQPSLDMKHKTWMKNYGEPDDLGNSWVQLKPRTYVEFKMPGDHDKWKSYLAKRRSTAAKDVHPFVDKTNYIDDGINIRTGRLLASVYPGPIVNHRLSTTADQQIIVNKGSFRFTNDVITYAAEIESSIRPIIPKDNDSMQIWLERALMDGLQAAEQEYLRLQGLDESTHTKSQDLDDVPF